MWRLSELRSGELAPSKEEIWRPRAKAAVNPGTWLAAAIKGARSSASSLQSGAGQRSSVARAR